MTALPSWIPQETWDAWRKSMSYDPETGEFRWLVKRAPCYKPGDLVGTVMRSGHRRIHAHGELILAHRLAFVFMTGELPKGDVDHINGIRDDNRWVNLRVASKAVNAQNRRRPNRNNSSGAGYLGVTRDAGRKWRAAICVGGRQMYLGLFETAEAARDAYVAAKRLHHEGGML